jgi:hypothetical protein
VAGIGKGQDKGSVVNWVPYSSFTSHTQDMIHTSFFLYMSISRLDYSLDLVIQSINTANTVTLSIAVFNMVHNSLVSQGRTRLVTKR